MFSTVHVMYVLKSDHIHESDYSSDNVWQVCWFGLCNSRFCCMVRDITLFKQSRLHILIHNMKKTFTQNMHTREPACVARRICSARYSSANQQRCSVSTDLLHVGQRRSRDRGPRDLLWRHVAQQTVGWRVGSTHAQRANRSSSQQNSSLFIRKKVSNLNCTRFYSVYCTQITLYLHILSLFVQPSF